MELLQRRFGKRYFVFVDDTFNVDPKWCDAFAEEVLRRGLKFQFYAFLRADLILRDEKLGVFEKLVRAGLIHAAIGVERLSERGAEELPQGVSDREHDPRVPRPPAHEVSAGVHPDHVFGRVCATTRARSILAQGEYAKSLKPDYAGFHPLTPVPGTRLWREALEKGMGPRRRLPQL